MFKRRTFGALMLGAVLAGVLSLGCAQQDRARPAALTGEREPQAAAHEHEMVSHRTIKGHYVHRPAHE